MVEVGDKVFITSVSGDKDNLAIITGPVGGTGPGGTSGILEGDYNTWTFKWIHEIQYLDDEADIGFHIDEANELIYMHYWIYNAGWFTKFKVCNLSDFSIIFDSPDDSKYTKDGPYVYNDSPLYQGFVEYDEGGTSRSLNSYILLHRADGVTWEVWRKGVKLWSHDYTEDVIIGSFNAPSAALDVTGKYIILLIEKTDAPYGYYLMLYEGFDSGTSTGVSETTISDISKAWAEDALIGHIVYVTSGGADEQFATITSNTGAVITCSAATFVTWGMEVGDTYKID